MNGLLKTLIKPDWDDYPKRSEILHAANEHDQLGDTTTLADPTVVESLVENRRNI